MMDAPELSIKQKKTLLEEVQREDLLIFTAVRMAKADALAGNFNAAVTRLRFDGDKIRTRSQALYEIIKR